MMNLKKKALRVICGTAAAAVMSAMILTSCAGMPEAPASSGSTSSGTSGSASTSAPASSAPASSSQPASSGMTEENSPSSSTASSSTSQANTVAAYQQEVLRLVNIERQKAGVAPLTMNNTALTAAAMKRAEETKTLFSHTRPDGTSCFTALAEYKVDWKYICGENIAKGQRTPAEVVDDWMNSEGHRRNILNGAYTQMGVGCVKNGYGYCWVQLFIG